MDCHASVQLSSDSVLAKATQMSPSKLLSRHPNLVAHDDSFYYRRAIGKLNSLEKSPCSDIAAYVVHQCARLSVDPKVEHASAVRWVARYLKGTCDKGFIIIRPNDTGLKMHVVADFSGNWDADIAHFDKDTARSRHGYFIMFAGYPIVWA